MNPPPDNNYRVYSDLTGVQVAGETFAPDNPELFDDVLKMCDCQDVAFWRCNINPDGGNREDGVDIMCHCERVSLLECRIGSGGKYAVTIKGGPDNIYLRRCVITTPGASPERVDIDIGNYSHTTPNARTGTVYITEVTREDGKPVRVRVGWANRPVVVGGNVKILFWQSLALKCYVLFRRIFG